VVLSTADFKAMPPEQAKKAGADFAF